MKFDLQDSIAILERTPAVLRSWLAGLPQGWTTGTEGPDTWSAFDVVGHLIDGEETDWIPRARIVLSREPNRTFVPFDRFRHLRTNKGRRLDELLEQFAALRAANLATLRGFSLTPELIGLTAEHPELGTVTLAQLIATWAVHDLGHAAQIGRVMAKQYQASVGPWEAYLPVLQR